MRKLFVKNIILLQGLNLIIKPIWLLLIDRMAQNLLGETVYGEYYIILNLTLVSNIILDIGIQNFNNASVASDHLFFTSNFKNLILAKLMLSFIYLMLVAWIGYGLNMNNELLYILLINQVITSFVLYFRSNISGLHHYQVDSILSVSDKFFAIVLCVAFFYTTRVTVFYFALAQLLASGMSLLIAFFINLRYFRSLPKTQESKVESIFTLLKKSMPYALLFALMGLYTKGDVLMMKWLLPDALMHCGLYAQSVRLLDASNMFAMLFAGLLLPMFAKLITNHFDVKPLTNMAAKILALISLTIASASVLMGEQILNLLYDYDTYEQLVASAVVFRNIMLCFIPMSLIYVFSTLLTAKGDIWYMNIFALMALCVNITLNLFLIPEYKSYGASLSSFVTQAVFSVLCIGRCFKLFSFRFDPFIILRYLAFIICLTGVYFVVSGIGNTWLILLVYSITAIILAILLKIMDVGKIFQTFKGSGQ